MNKKIIIPLVVAAIVACGIGYCSYVTAKASTITKNIMLPTNTSSNSDSSNTNIENIKTSNGNNQQNNIISLSSNNNLNTNTQDTVSTSHNSSSNINNRKITIVNKYAYVVNCDNPLAIFKSPCDTSHILISVPGNEKVYVYNKLPNGWAYVEYHGVKGYMITAELIFL